MVCYDRFVGKPSISFPFQNRVNIQISGSEMSRSSSSYNDAISAYQLIHADLIQLIKHIIAIKNDRLFHIAELFLGPKSESLAND